MKDHSVFLRRCLELAELGAGHVSPNPMVGSVIVRNDKIIGEGYHMRYGDAHAEVNAIRDFSIRFPESDHLLKESTLYVNLEPCAHAGKTPPCADLIIQKGIREVVIGCRDPFKEVNGKGVSRLIESGVKVIEGVMQEECQIFNRRFFTRVEKRRPYIILKWAETKNGFIATNDLRTQWISSSQSRQLVHKWRTEEDAILVGKLTALHDNPQLNAREWFGRNPLRMVVDRNLSLPHDLEIFNQKQQTIIFNSKLTDIIGQCKYLELENLDTLMPNMIAYQLYLMDIQSMIVEGGPTILTKFLESGIWDEVRVFKSKNVWEDGIHAPNLSKNADHTELVGSDHLAIWFNKD